MRTVAALILLGGLLLSASSPGSAVVDRRATASATAGEAAHPLSPGPAFTAVNTSLTSTPVDTDGDGLADAREVNVFNTDPHQADTDGDGLTDGAEVHRFHTSPIRPDTDGDGLTDRSEIHRFLTDPNQSDTDGDGLTDGSEVHRFQTAPTRPDTDGDGSSDREVINHSTERSNNATASQSAIGQEGENERGTSWQWLDAWTSVNLWLLLTRGGGILVSIVVGLVGGQYAIGRAIRLLPLRWRLRLRGNPRVVRLRQRYMQTTLYTHFQQPKRCPACGTTSGDTVHTRQWFCSYDCYHEWQQLCHRTATQASTTQSGN